MAKPGSDRDGAMVDKQAGKKVRLTAECINKPVGFSGGVFFFFFVNSGWDEVSTGK